VGEVFKSCYVLASSPQGQSAMTIALTANSLHQKIFYAKFSAGIGADGTCKIVAYRQTL
jgi:hypothetical protein